MGLNSGFKGLNYAKWIRMHISGVSHISIFYHTANHVT